MTIKSSNQTRYAKIKQDDTYGLWLVYVTGSNEPRAALKTHADALAWCDKRNIEVNSAAYSSATRRRVSMVEHVMFGSAR